MEELLKLAYRGWAIFIIFFLLGAFPRCFAGEKKFNVCEQVSDDQLTGIYQKKLFPIEQERGCQWSDKPGGRVYFQIGVIESQKNLRDFFQKEIPPNIELKKSNDLGDRCLLTVSEGYLAVVVIREGDWVLVSTVNFLKIKQRSEKQKYLWDIYRGILRKLP
jgi:hypothetical protein